MEAPAPAPEDAAEAQPQRGARASPEADALQDARAASTLKARGVRLVTALALVNAASLALLVLAGSRYPGITSPGILAFTFGLRHAVDADHISAIDNVTRKLVQDGGRPLTVGLWFSLGHSSVVCILCCVVLVGSSFVHSHLSLAESVGAVLGTSVSVTVLYIIGSVNLATAIRLVGQRYHLRQRARGLSSSLISDRVATHQEHQCNPRGADNQQHHGHAVSVTPTAEIHGPGCMAACCSKAFQFVDSPLKMCPVGFLFGLGFDTASEVALLALAALAPKEGIPAPCVLLLPLLFSSGMALIDTLDSILMLWAYGWASINPVSRVCFNLYLTASSALIAILVGTLEMLAFLRQELHLQGRFWDAVGLIMDHSEYLGFAIVAFFATSAVVTIGCLRWS